MNFTLGTELTSILRTPVAPPIGPVNDSLPQLSGAATIGSTLSVSNGGWTGTGALTFAYQWTRDGVAIQSATLGSYQLVAADDQALITCRVSATDGGGTTTVSATGVNGIYAAPVFSVQPGLTPGSATIGDVLTLTLGTTQPNALISIVSFTLDGVDKTSEMTGLDWDSAGEMAGNLTLQVLATNSGGSTLSNVIGGTLSAASATVPDPIQDADWGVTDAANGAALDVAISTMADDGGAPITAVEYQLDAAGPWVSSGLTGPGGFSIGGLQVSQAYSVVLRVVNALGSGAPSTAKSATVGAGVQPNVALTTINKNTGEIDMSGVSEAGTYFGLVNYSAAQMTGSAIETAVIAGTPDAHMTFAIASGANASAYDKSAVTPGTAYFHGTVKNSAGNYSADVPLAFIQPFVDVDAPVLLSSAPANGAANQPANTNITLTFDENVQFSTGQVELFNVTAAGIVEQFNVATGAGDQGGTISVSANVVTINPGADLTVGTQFALRSIPGSAISDAAQNPFAGWVNDITQLNFTTAAAGSGAVFVGDASSSTWAINHVLNAASVSQTPLPATFGAGKYVILAGVAVTKDVTTASLDGVPAILRANVVTGSERVAVYDVTIPGGGDGTVSLGLSGNADDVGVAVWEVGARSFVSAVAQNFTNRKIDTPADLGIATQPLDSVLAAVLHSDPTASSTWTGLTEVVASRVLSDRVFAAAQNGAATGGTPEVFQWAPTVNWVGVGAALAVYR